MHRLQDRATGLYNDAFFHASLPTRLASARRALRPLSIVLFAVGGPQPGAVDRSGDAEREVAAGLRRTLRESDIACRLDTGGFALLLDETPGFGAVLTIDRVRALLEDEGSPLLLWAGVGTYPSHALDAGALLAAAEVALADAMAWEHSRIEVALPA